jgi:hypothetical protein
LINILGCINTEGKPEVCVLFQRVFSAMTGGAIC